MEKKEIEEQEEKRSQKLMKDRIKQILREDEWQNVGLGSSNSPSHKFVEKKRRSLLPSVVPSGMQVNLLGFQLSPGAISQQKRIERIQEN